MTEPSTPVSTQQIVEGVPVTVLRDRGARTQVCVGARVGGLVMQLVLNERQWLHRNAYVSLAHRYESKLGAAGSPRSYLERGDVGLGDQCLFTVAADTLTLPDGGKVSLKDHGEVWALAGSAVEVSRVGEVLRTEWVKSDGPLTFTFRRDLRLDQGAVHADFLLTNSGEKPLPLFWSSHDMVELNADTRFDLPAGTEMVVHQAKRVDFQSGPHQWPRFVLKDGRPLDLSHPVEARAMLGRDFAVKVFSREPVGPLKVRQKGAAIELDSAGTRAGLWINWGGDSPPGERYQLACPERSFGGATDRVSEGLTSGDTEWLEPGGDHRWEMRYVPS